MALLENLGTLITANISFDNDELETLLETVVNKASAVTGAAQELKTLTADATDADAVEQAASSLVDLASEIGTAFPRLTPEQVGRFKAIVDDVYENTSPEIDAAVQKVFDLSVDLLADCQALNSFVNALDAAE